MHSESYLQMHLHNRVYNNEQQTSWFWTAMSSITSRRQDSITLRPNVSPEGNEREINLVLKLELQHNVPAVLLGAGMSRWLSVKISCVPALSEVYTKKNSELWRTFLSLRIFFLLLRGTECKNRDSCSTFDALKNLLSDPLQQLGDKDRKYRQNKCLDLVLRWCKYRNCWFKSMNIFAKSF